MAIAFALFLAGMLTVLLPCILPLLPIVLGVSISGKSVWRPLVTVFGMLLSFVGFTFLLLTILDQFVELSDYIRLSTYYVLFLFGTGFLTRSRNLQLLGAVIGGFYFSDKGWIAVTVAQTVGATMMELGTKIVTMLQKVGGAAQEGARNWFGAESLLTAFIIGLTLGLVWVPCAGPALGFAFALVREEPGVRALFLLLCYGLGTAVPLLAVGYGGQIAIRSVRSLSAYTGRIKKIAGVMLLLTSVGLFFSLFEKAQIFLIEKTGFGSLGTRLERRLFLGDMYDALDPEASSVSSTPSMQRSTLPRLIRAPEFLGLGPWHNLPAGRQDSEPFSLVSLKGKVVLVDFWTYSCINCIRTLPYIQGYWETFKDTGKFVLIGVHSPEFVFEKSEKNVADAIRRHGLTYPIAQDNDFKTWRAFSNRYWPAKYLIDAEGYVRYTHFGEGAYVETEEAIRSLLEEIGVAMEETEEIEEADPSTALRTGETEERRALTPETYLGSRSWQAFGNRLGEPDFEEHIYEAPGQLALHTYALHGTWKLSDGEESQVLLSSEGEVHMRFLGGEMNLVLGLRDGARPVSAEIFIDGERHTSITIDRHDLYNLFTGDYGEHEMTLKIYGSGVEAFAFTFGG